MAKTAYGVNHPLAVKHWSRRLKVEALKATRMGQFIGTGTNSLIYRKDELKKDKGDKITMGLRVQLTGDGILGDGVLEGKEEALTTHNDAIYIDQLRHAVRSAGKMSEQRVPFDVRDEAMAGLKDWWADRMDASFANQLAGNSDQTDVRYTGLQAAIAPDASHIISGNGHNTEASLSAGTGHIIKLADIDRMVTMAKTFGKEPDGSTDENMPMRPIRIDGGEYYALFMHPDAVYQLRTDANSGEWRELQQNAIQGGQTTGNPLFTGALGMYNNTVLHEWSRLPHPPSSVASNTSYRRSVFCGAQAACLAFGGDGSTEDPNWVEELFDYGNQLGVSAGMIFGAKKARYNDRDFGTIVCSSFAPSQKN